MSIIATRTRERLAALSMADQLAAIRAKLTPDERASVERVEGMLAERRHRTEHVAVERRGRNPQRRGFESDQSDVAFAFVADQHLDEKDD